MVRQDVQESGLNFRLPRGDRNPMQHAFFAAAGAACPWMSEEMLRSCESSALLKNRTSIAEMVSQNNHE